MPTHLSPELSEGDQFNYFCPMSLPRKEIVAELHTDGSCHTQYGIGAWVAIVLDENKKEVLTGTAIETNHNRMELTAVIKGIEYLKLHNNSIKSIKIFTDSQYVMGLPVRKEKLTSLGFTTKTGKKIQNADLVLSLLENIEQFDVEWCKVRAHQKKKEVMNYNIEADKLCRKIMRELVAQQPTAIVTIKFS